MSANSEIDVVQRKRQSLERFVVDNDELQLLEERIGRFNIFDALGIVRTEIRHSNFLAWLLDPSESHGQGSPQQWLSIWIKVGAKQCFCVIKVTPASDSDLRRRVIERLIADPKEFSIKSLFKTADLIGDKWATLGRVNIERWSSDDGPDMSVLLPKVRATLEKRAKELAGVPDALKPIVSKWRASHSAPK